jgi:hypothetical protein
MIIIMPYGLLSSLSGQGNSICKFANGKNQTDIITAHEENYKK